MNKILALLLGLVLVVAPLWAALTYDAWGTATVVVLQGCVIIFAVLAGLALLMAAISGMKS